MDGIVTAVIGKDWCLIEFDDGDTTGKMWRIKLQGDPERQLPFKCGDRVKLEKAE